MTEAIREGEKVATTEGQADLWKPVVNLSVTQSRASWHDARASTRLNSRKLLLCGANSQISAVSYILSKHAAPMKYSLYLTLSVQELQRNMSKSITKIYSPKPRKFYWTNDSVSSIHEWHGQKGWTLPSIKWDLRIMSTKYNMWASFRSWFKHTKWKDAFETIGEGNVGWALNGVKAVLLSLLVPANIMCTGLSPETTKNQTNARGFPSKARRSEGTD